jgi:hypothetical protein
MKVVFSRKGFDSSTGGCASPIIDGHLVSLPIPDDESPITYADVQCSSIGSLGPIVESLTGGRILPTTGAHLDPDLDQGAIPRLDGWRPIFGQVDAAQSHLVNQGVGKGDLFLMFGWFREAARHGVTLRFVPGAPDLHIIYGWLQIGDVIELGTRPARPGRSVGPAWSHYHPHYYGTRGSNNVLYVAAPTLVLDGVDTGLPGAGRCDGFHHKFRLTAEGSKLRGIWRLPEWFDPSRSSKPLSYHASRERWKGIAGGYRLQSAGRGQEFVFDSGVYPEAMSWIREIMECQSRGTIASISAKTLSSLVMRENRST